MSSKDISNLVPVFNSQDFRAWQQKMKDYLGSQKLWGFAAGTRVIPTPANPAAITAAEQAAIDDWLETDLQVSSLIALRLSTNLRTHLGATSAITWTSLDTTFGQPHFTTIFGEFTEALRVKMSPTHNPQVEIQRLWTILEHLRANGCVLSDYLQGMILLRAIPKEWDNVAAMYCNGMTMSNVTFVGVRNAVVAEFERRARPSQVAHFADRISVVKRKGKSPSFKEQSKPKYSAPKAPEHDNAPSGSSNKKVRRGGKKEKARRAHAIVSSALIPPAVLNRMHESHHARIIDVPMDEQLPAPRAQIIVGGPSRAPLSATPITIAGFKPAGVSYTKVPPVPPTQYHGRSQTGVAPFKYSKVVSGEKPPSVFPMLAPNTVEQAEETQEQIMEILKKQRAFTKFATASTLVRTAVANTTAPEPGPSKPTFHVPTPTPEDHARWNERVQKSKAKKRADAAKAKAKKAKAKECVHLPLSMMGDAGTSVRTNPVREVSNRPNSCDENGEPLYDYSTRDFYGKKDFFPDAEPRLNPKHARAPFYRELRRLMDNDKDLTLQPDLSDFIPKLQALDKVDTLDWGTDADDSSSDEDDVDDDIAAAAGISRLSLTPAPLLSSKAKGKQRAIPNEERMGPDERDNNPDSYAYDDYGYHRSVLTHSPSHTTTNDEKQQLLIAISSLESRIEFINSHAINCAKCKTTNKTKDHTIEILADSGASASFTMEKSDLTEFTQITDKDLVVKTAAKDNSLMIKGKGALFVTHSENSGGKSRTITSRLYPVYYIPGLSLRLLSIGALLNDGLELRGSSSSLTFIKRNGKSWQTVLTCKPHEPSQTLYWLNARLASAHSLLALSTVFNLDYETMHRRFAHPSKDVLKHASGNTQNFPNSISFPKDDPVCPGCAEGKMTRSSFPPSSSRSGAPFDKIHMDLKELPVLSYNRYKFFILFFDDHTSHGWITLLRRKSEAAAAIRHFLAMAKTQFNAPIREFMIDAGGEFKSNDLSEFLKELGINTLTSVPHMHQQNGRAERFIRTIMDKAQAIRLEACIPQNWWEFAVNYAVHVYNHTPHKRDGHYQTPFERLRCTKPDIAHLRVFRCGAYVFLPEDIRTNSLSPKSELMTFIGYSEGTKGYIFMRSPNNIVYTAVKALFDETLFPKCPDMRRSGFIPLDQPVPTDNADEYNTPPEDYENGGNGGDLPFIPNGSRQLPWPPAYPHRPLSPPSPPESHTPEHGVPSDDDDFYASPPVLTPPRRHQTPVPTYDYDWDYQDIPFTTSKGGEPTFLFRPTRVQRDEPSPVAPRRMNYPRQRTPDSPTPPGERDTNAPSGRPLPQETLRLQPRRSGRTRQPVTRSDNLYGSQNPTDVERMSNREFENLFGDPRPSG